MKRMVLYSPQPVLTIGLGTDRSATATRAGLNQVHHPVPEVDIQACHLNELEALYRAHADLSRAIRALEKIGRMRKKRGELLAAAL